MSLENKSVLVTGGAGFIGSHLVDRIIQDEPERLTVVDNLFLGKDSNLCEARECYPELRVYHEDVSDYSTMKRIITEEGVDVVFHLAVIPLPASLERPAWTFRQNIDMILSVCELAREDAFETLIHFSSSEVYGTTISGPMDEEHPLNGTTPYAASKAASDNLVMSYCRTFGIDASIVRPFNNYGPRQNEGSYAGVIPLTILRVLRDEPVIIYGDGRQTRDYIYVTDTATAAVQVYNSKKCRHKTLNIASGQEISIEYLVRFILETMGYKKPIVYEPPRPGDVRRHIANIFLAKDLIDFSPTVPFEEGLKRTIHWYVSRYSLINR